MGREDRRYHRIEYFDEYRPQLSIRVKKGEKKSGWKSYKVLDVSEKGLRIAEDDAGGLGPQSEFEAQITFSDGESYDIEGKVLRVINNNELGIYLTRGIPLSRIIKEQKLLKSSG